MAANADAMVRDAIKAYRAGKKAEARALLEKATEADQYNEQAWMWLSAVVDSPEDQRTCLENVLFINPNNENARQGLRILESKMGTSPLPKSSPPPAPAPARPPVLPPDPEPIEDTGSWELPPTETSSSSAIYNPAAQVSSTELDEWMKNLPIGKQNTLMEDDYESAPVSSTIDDMFSNTYEDEDDDAMSRLDNMFSGDAKSPARPPSASMSAGPFSTDEFDYEDLDGADDDDFLVDLDIPEPPVPSVVNRPAAPAPSSPRMSPGRENVPSAPQPAKKSQAKTAASAGGSFYTGKEADPSADIDPGIYFREIPDEIKPTTLPGLGSSVSVRTMLILSVLVLLNLGAAIALALQLQG